MPALTRDQLRQRLRQHTLFRITLHLEGLAGLVAVIDDKPVREALLRQVSILDMQATTWAAKAGLSSPRLLKVVPGRGTAVKRSRNL